MTPHPELLDALLRPTRLWSRGEILIKPCPVPREAGVYAWYFREAPQGVPVDGCHSFEGMPLLYVGISPKKPPTNGASPSKQRLLHRVRYHYRGNADSPLSAGQSIVLTKRATSRRPRASKHLPQYRSSRLHREVPQFEG